MKDTAVIQYNGEKLTIKRTSFSPHPCVRCIFDEGYNKLNCIRKEYSEFCNCCGTTVWQVIKGRVRPLPYTKDRPMCKDPDPIIYSWGTFR